LVEVRRRLTGVARGGAFAIARHSLPRTTSSAAADPISDVSKAAMTKSDRNIGTPVSDNARAILYVRSPQLSLRQYALRPGPGCRQLAIGLGTSGTAEQHYLASAAEDGSAGC
jgi:hypothetical protein